MSEPRPVSPADPVTAPWWDATRERRLTLQNCNACGHHQHYPRALCAACYSTDLSFVEASGRGTVYSYTVVHRSPHPAFEAPYVVALVRLAEGPVVMANITGCPPDDVRCDLPVTVTWEDLPDGRRLPLFAPQGV